MTMQAQPTIFSRVLLKGMRVITWTGFNISPGKMISSDFTRSMRRRPPRTTCHLAGARDALAMPSIPRSTLRTVPISAHLFGTLQAAAARHFIDYGFLVGSIKDALGSSVPFDFDLADTSGLVAALATYPQLAMSDRTLL
jgi:hypothetical protein